MKYTLPGRPKLPPLKLINRITEKSPASEDSYFAFTALLEGARSKRFYRINNQEIHAFAANAFGGGEILKNATYEAKIRNIALDITARTLFELRLSGYVEIASAIRKYSRYISRI